MDDLAFIDPKASPDYWAARYPGFSWAPVAYELFAQHFVDSFDYTKSGYKRPFQEPEPRNRNKKTKTDSESKET